MRPRYPFILKRHQSTVPLPRSASEDLVTLRAALRGTVPEHQALLLLHTETHPKKWPTDVNKVSPLLREIQAHVKEFNGKVLMCYPGDANLLSKARPLLNQSQTNENRHYTATFFTKLTPPFEIPFLNAEVLPNFLRFFAARMQTGVNVASVLPGASTAQHDDLVAARAFQARSLFQSSLLSQQVDRKKVKKTWILVCTHGARDCRCGERGTEVVQLMRKYIHERPGLSSQVIVAEVSHVGGHRYAPNVLVYPQGDWYSTLQPKQVKRFMDSLLGVDEENDDSYKPLLGPSSQLWRGSWFDHPGVPTRATHVGDLAGEALGEEEQRSLSRARLELMRDEREIALKGGQDFERLDEEWGMDLDRIGKGD